MDISILVNADGWLFICFFNKIISKSAVHKFYSKCRMCEYTMYNYIHNIDSIIFCRFICLDIYTYLDMPNQPTNPRNTFSFNRNWCIYSTNNRCSLGGLWLDDRWCHPWRDQHMTYCCCIRSRVCKRAVCCQSRVAVNLLHKGGPIWDKPILPALV